MTTKDTIMALHDEACEAHHCNGSHLYNQVTAEKREKLKAAVEAALAPQQVPEPLTARELELIDGMIGVQLEHAMRCDQIANRRMAEKQKGWDMERVALLQKIKAASPQPAPQQVPEWSVFAKHGRIYFSVGNQSFPLEYHPEDEPECSAAQASDWYMGQLRHALSRLAAAAPQPAPQPAKWVGLTESHWKSIVYSSDFKKGAEWANVVLKQLNGGAA